MNYGYKKNIKLLLQFTHEAYFYSYCKLSLMFYYTFQNGLISDTKLKAYSLAGGWLEYL